MLCTELLVLVTISAATPIMDLPGHPNTCKLIRCPEGGSCVTREFWCSKDACPQMAYCSNSDYESIFGPTSCRDVICSDGFACNSGVVLCPFEDCRMYMRCAEPFTMPTPRDEEMVDEAETSEEETLEMPMLWPDTDTSVDHATTIVPGWVYQDYGIDGPEEQSTPGEKAPGIVATPGTD